MFTGLESHLVKRYPDGFLLDLKLNASPGIHVLFGPSGSGKSTALRLIAGITSATGGFARLNGITLFNTERVISLPAHKRGAVLMFQEDTLFPHLTAEANVAYASGDRHQADVLLERFGLENLKDRLPSDLSGGERRRVALLRAWAASPRILLLDEPLTGVDIAGGAPILSALRQMQEETEIPVIYVSHSPAECLKIGDRMIMLQGGRAVQEGIPSKVLQGPTNRDLFQLLENINVWKAKIKRQLPAENITQVNVNGLTMEMRSIKGAVGENVVIGLPVDDVIIAPELIGSTSALNRFSGILRTIERENGRILLTATAAEVPIRIRVMQRSLSQMDLKPGQRISLIFKAWNVQRLA